MKLAYVTKNDSSDLDVWSGTAYYINRALTGAGIQTLPIGNLKEGPHFLTTGIKKVLYKCLLFKNFDRLRYPPLVRHLCRQIDDSLSRLDYDAVFAVGGSAPLSYLQTNKPIVYWSDYTYAALVGFYPNHTHLCVESFRDGNLTEQLFLSKCRLAIFSSEWAANTALKYYDLDPAKVKVVPFGANLECNRDIPKIKNIISNKNFDICKLLFVGKDWLRKGGDLAVKVAELLYQRGIKTELHVLGCHPPCQMPGFVKQHGFLSKKTEQGRHELDGLYSNAHFLILPTRAECYGIVFAEASSFGLPSLAPGIGGVQTVIRNGRNGRTFLPNDGPEKYCEYISGLISDRLAYEKLALSSFQEYTERLNWKTAGQKTRDLIIEFCGSK